MPGVLQKALYQGYYEFLNFFMFMILIILVSQSDQQKQFRRKWMYLLEGKRTFWRLYPISQPSLWLGSGWWWSLKKGERLAVSKRKRGEQAWSRKKRFRGNPGWSHWDLQIPCKIEKPIAKNKCLSLNRKNGPEDITLSEMIYIMEVQIMNKFIFVYTYDLC